MGLDMYLEKRTYVKTWNHTPANRRWEIEVKYAGKPVEFNHPVTYLTFEAAYWRKANAIHKWFVDNCQDGRDECQQTLVPEEKLADLLALCKEVLAKAQIGQREEIVTVLGPEPGFKREPRQLEYVKNAEEIAALLPTEGGFFFGSTDYDSNYLDDIRLTIKQLTNALADETDGEFYYQATW